METWESRPTVPLIGRRHLLKEFSLVEERFLGEAEVFYQNIDSLEHLSMSGERVHLRLHLQDGSKQTIRGMPETFVAELSDRIENAE